MRIGFLGAGASGKTVTGRLVADSLGATFVPSVSREVFLERGITQEAMQHGMRPGQLLDLQRAIFDRYSLRLGEAIASGADVVADRTLLDHFCYMLYRCAPVIDEDMLGEASTAVIKNLALFGLLVFCPTGLVPVHEDGFREESPAYRAMTDAMIRGFLERWDIAYAVLPPGTVEQRVAHVVTLANGMRGA